MNSKIIIYLLVVQVICLKCILAVKISLFDSTKMKDDLNWSKISFKESPQSLAASSAVSNDPSNWIKDKLNAINLYGWKESSFSLYGGDDVWRIYFVCDLNIQNIQNWLFTPLIETKNANRVTLNLTFTIRECEQFPIKQVVKNCREKFELYYEEVSDNLEQEQEQNNTSIYFLNKIKQLRFRDTFVSDTGLRYYNSVVDRQKAGSYSNSRPGESSINVELREIPLSTNKKSSYIRFAIRDTGACISLLSVELSYLTCSEFSKYGIVFPETSTGRDLTDLVQVNGKCPDNTVNTQQPKAICTAKGEWLITDQNLSNRCLCLPGYEFIEDKCSQCPVGFYKSSTSNEIKCVACPDNSWSNRAGSDRCECLSDYYRENELNPDEPCRAIQQITADNLNVQFINQEKTNISISRVSSLNKFNPISQNVRLEIRCYVCNKISKTKEECDSNCFISQSSNDWIVIMNKNQNKHLKMKLVIKQKLNERELSKSNVYFNLNQVKHRTNELETEDDLPSHLKLNKNYRLNTQKSLYCELAFSNKNNEQQLEEKDNRHHATKSLCLNMSINLNQQLSHYYPNSDLINRIKTNKYFHMNIFASLLNNDYELIPSNKDSNLNLNLNQRSNYIQLRLLENLNIKNLILNNTYLPIVICNLFEIETLKLEFSFRNINANQEGSAFMDSDSEDSLDDIDLLNKFENKLDIYTIDVKISDVCIQKQLLAESSRPNSVTTSNHSVLAIKSANHAQFDPNSGNNSDQSAKIHIILPIILSFFFVTFIILLAIFFRIRINRFNGCKADEKEYNCENHIRRFMPGLTKSCSNKCINCSNNISANSSSSSTTSSSSPSTTCTTSQILERNSKLYYVDPHTYEDPALAIQEFAQEIQPLDIKIESVIGGGEFGDVCKGKLKNIHGIWVTVAIKTLKVGSSEKNRCDFLTEASIMAQFHHENIICLEGVVTQSHPYMIITEYMDNGSLDTFLRLNSWRLNIYDLIKMLRDIANGMKYLSEMNFVHRDLAARNILVNKTLQCKVADFGLSREIEGTTTEGVYWTKGGKIPVRWTAPEAISHTKFTCSSDVWSFGVVAWEVLSYGERPYWNWSNTDVIKAVEKGFRLLIPPNCPQVLYNMMLECWETDRLKRPRFKQIVQDLDSLVKSKKESLYTSTKNLKQVSYIDTNRPNFAQLTSIYEWLNSLNLNDLNNTFVDRRYLNLSQVLNFDKNDLLSMDIYDESQQKIILESIKCIQFELNFQNGFLV